MEFLYVCAFSNGQIKVGRSIFPEHRVTQHIARMQGGGAFLDRRHIVECVDDNTERREALLIGKCANACTERSMFEWFAGLAFDEVCAWANHCAVCALPALAAWMTLFDIPGIQSRLARELDVSIQAVNNWRRRGIPVEHCARVERLCSGEFTRRDFRPNDWHLIWPELATQDAEIA